MYKTKVDDSLLVEVGGDGPMYDEPTLYFHIGLWYKSPIRATFSRMTLNGDADETGGRGEDHVLVRAENEYLTAHRAFARLCFSDHWSMVVYELETTVRPIASMIPGAVSCKKVSCADALIWSPPRIALRAAGGGADDDLDDDDDGGAESDDVAPSEASDDAIAGVDAPLSEAAALATAYVEALDDGADVGGELRDLLADGAAPGEVG